MFKTVLIANRGAIACRIIRTLKTLNIRAVVVYSAADAGSLHVAEADTAICLGEGDASATYLSIPKILAAAKDAGAEAIHPGYGFLSENADFAVACAQQGLVFIGPSPAQIRVFGLKHSARAMAESAGVPILAGSGILPDVLSAQIVAEKLGYPVMLKSTAGGGGIGMRICANKSELASAFAGVQRLAKNAFHCGDLYLEKFLSVARHIEVQIFGDGNGTVVALGERDCSAQRRQQKVLEETPAPGLSAELRRSLCAAAVRLGESVNYVSAGTVEFILDAATMRYYFLEVNTRLQVEHGITEEVAGIDLVGWMLKQAAGELHLDTFTYQAAGVAIEARIYAEDPNHSFRPSAGLLTEAVFPHHARIETWVERGTEISSYYDPMLAKIIVHAPTRAEAVTKLSTALAETRLAGIESNLCYLRQAVGSQDFATGLVSTSWLNGFKYEPATIDVIDAGTQSSIQDYPGRMGYWAIGVPPSGPMDDLAFRIANELVGNESTAAGLEMTLRGPTLKFNHAASIALTGALMTAELDGAQVPYWQTIKVQAGSVLTLGSISGSGCRTYLAVSGGGFAVPEYLGSKSTFSLGKFGGHGGRTLRQGDVIPIFPAAKIAQAQRHAPASLAPTYNNHWQIQVLYGPHGAPDFFTEEFLGTFLSSDWTVHYNSNRLGIRLIGPKPSFARTDGGEAGLHPSNIHDNEYAIGTINFTGDLPVILAKDGPSLGGFVCPVTIIKSELWKVGQLRPGDSIRFMLTSFAAALAAEQRQDEAIALLAGTAYAPPVELVQDCTSISAILNSIEASASAPAVVYRQAGDKYVLIEYGPAVLDLDLRFRVYALMEWFKRHPLPGIIELSPGVRSLQVHFDSRHLSRDELLRRLMQAEAELPAVADLEFPTRILRLPFAFDASTTKAAIEKYQQSVRQTAPWLPQNIEFIRRINGLDSSAEVEEKIFAARYLVLGLGDVYLGAPCAVPIDPRHRLVTTKYNPARTWTAEGEVGIGGVYMCIYGMESPGGYQLVGRTAPVWNTYKQTAATESGKPWLLRFFDQIQFFPMPEDELIKFRREFIHGRASIEIKHETFRVRDYHAFLQREEASIATFKAKQQVAFEEERERWSEDEALGSAALQTPDSDEAAQYTEGAFIGASIAGNVWSINVQAGDLIKAGQCVAVIEAMKMEVAIEASFSGVVKSVNVAKGKLVVAGQPLMTMEA